MYKDWEEFLKELHAITNYNVFPYIAKSAFSAGLSIMHTNSLMRRYAIRLIEIEDYYIMSLAEEVEMLENAFHDAEIYEKEEKTILFFTKLRNELRKKNYSKEPSNDPSP